MSLADIHGILRCCVTDRLRLPGQMYSRGIFSVWTFLKQCIGKVSLLIAFFLPIVFVNVFIMHTGIVLIIIIIIIIIVQLS